MSDELVRRAAAFLEKLSANDALIVMPVQVTNVNTLQHTDSHGYMQQQHLQQQKNCIQALTQHTLMMQGAQAGTSNQAHHQRKKAQFGINSTCRQKHSLKHGILVQVALAAPHANKKEESRRQHGSQQTGPK